MRQGEDKTEMAQTTDNATTILGVTGETVAPNKWTAVRKWNDGPFDIMTLRVTVRMDDECRNGRDTFSITADLRRNRREEACGCLHDEIAEHFPELEPLIKWHLVSTDEPMHYTQNALYWAGYCGWRDGKPGSPPNLDHFASTIVFGALETDKLDDLRGLMWAAELRDGVGSFLSRESASAPLRAMLQARLPLVMAQFKKAMVENCGFTWNA